jgi:hypothetical protein
MGDTDTVDSSTTKTVGEQSTEPSHTRQLVGLMIAVIVFVTTFINVLPTASLVGTIGAAVGAGFAGFIGYKLITQL